MIQTRLCALLDIEAPIIQAAIWPATSPALVAAVGEAGAIGSIGAVFGSAEGVTAGIEAVRELTGRPFIVNHVVSQLDHDAFEATLDAKPAVISFALGDPAGLVERAHDVGAKVIHQVHTVRQAREVAEQGVDVIIAQGSEAGGQGMAAGVGAMALVPQVVDAVDPVPVVVAGGVADGRGLAAALALGAKAQTWARASLPRRRRPAIRPGRSRSSRPTPRTPCASKPGASSFRPPATRLTTWRPGCSGRRSWIGSKDNRKRHAPRRTSSAPRSWRSWLDARPTSSSPSPARRRASSERCCPPARSSSGW
jgi:hypothetical protein